MTDTNLKQEIEIFKTKMEKVESLISKVNEENKELQLCFANLMKLMNHELINSFNESSQILNSFKLKNYRL